MTQAGSLALIGGHPALDLTNTAGWHASADRIEWLTDYGALLEWFRHAGLLAPAKANRLSSLAIQHPQQAGRAVKHAIEVREVLYRIFAAVARGKTPADADLERLREEELRALRAAAAEWSGTALVFTWPGTDDLLLPLYPVVLAAVELLRDPPAGRLRQCGNHPCGWLFIDRSRNGSRRWCSSGDCGNEIRVRRFRAKR
jgi:predicted RNA-binding Zn ribbon-like protein